ncbi:radical SAM protein [bacterium]|nr:radical SAM protein [candidate division CSSED10-310 bacterium]
MKITQLYQLANTLHAAVPKRLFPGGYALPPLRVGCVLTHRCNLRCAMCFVWKHGDRDLADNELSTSEWTSIIDQIPRQAIVTFTGGEPLVRADIRELLDHACRKHRVHLVSNGTLFDENMINQSIESASRSIFHKGLVSIGVSLEGPESVHDAMVKIPGSFAKTTRLLETIASLKKQKRIHYPLLDLKIVICRETLDSLIDLYELADHLGLDIISYQQCSTQESSYGIDSAPANAVYETPPPVTPIPRDEIVRALNELNERAKHGRTIIRFNPDMDFELFADRYENRFPLDRFTCLAAWSIMHIGPYGTVFPCFSLPMGNLREQRLMDIWNGSRYRAFRRKLRKECIFPGCTGCCVMRLNR